MKHLVFVFLIIGLFAGCNVQKQAEMYHQKGVASLKKNDFTKAESNFLRSINEYPTKETYYDLAQLYKKTNKKCEYCKCIQLFTMYGYNDSIGLFYSDCFTKDEYIYENDSSLNIEKSTCLYIDNCNHKKDRIYVFRKNGNIIYSFFLEKWDGQNDTKMLDSFPDPNNNKNIVYTQIEDVPLYKGGESARMEFLNNNLIYPEISRVENKQGIVKITITIDENGYVTNPYVIYSVDKNLDKEALRVVNLMPKWIPGKFNGVNVKMRFVLPIIFRLT